MYSSQFHPHRARATTYEPLRFGVEMPNEAAMTTQERAYTPPI